MVLSYWTLGAAYEQKGLFERAIDVYQRSIEVGSTATIANSLLIHAYARSGQPEKARVCLAQLEELSKSRYVPQIAFVIAYEGLLEIDLALDARETNLVQINVWHLFDALREHPRFHEVERRVGLRQ